MRNTKTKRITSVIMALVLTLTLLPVFTLPAQAAVNLIINMTVDNSMPMLGDTIIYTITVRNDGDEDGSSVIVTDPSDPRLTFISAVPSRGTYDPYTGMWTIGSIAAGETVTLAIQVQVFFSGSYFGGLFLAYGTLQDAINAASGGSAASPITLNFNGATITLSSTTYVSDRSATPNAARHIKLENVTVKRDAGMTGDVINIPVGSTLTLGDGVIIDGGWDGVSAPTISNGIVGVNGTLNMQTGSTVRNNSKTGNGGAVWINNSGVFNMFGGTITGNSAQNGGAVYVSGGEFSMSGGLISGNTAVYGGAVYVAGTTARVSINGGDISGNTGGGLSLAGVYWADGTLSVSGAPKIGSASDTNQIYRRLNTQAININGNLTSGAYINVGWTTGDTANTKIATKTSGTLTDTEAGYFHYLNNPEHFPARVGNDIILREAIANASVNITVPATGVAPNGTATGTGNFTVGTVTWSPAHNPFRGGTAYTASVTLTANTGYLFGSAMTTANINGTSATVSNNTGTQITLSRTFGATGAAAVTGVSVKTQPAKLIYSYGEKLDLSGLVVTLTYNDGTTEDVAFANFTSKNVTASPVNGTPLVGSQTITISCNGRTAQTSTLTVAQLTLQDRINAASGGTPGSPVTINLGGQTVTISATLRIADTSVTPNAARHIVFTNGTIIRGSYTGDMIYLPAGSSLTLGNGITIDSNNAIQGNSIILADGSLTMQTGSVVKNHNKNNGSGGGVYVRNDGVFNMAGGEISGCSASGGGGAVYVIGNGFFNMTGGIIKNNTTVASGGGVQINSATASIEFSGSAEISGNTGGGGSGIYLQNGTLNVSGAPKIGSVSDTNAILRRLNTQVINITGNLTAGAYINVERLAADTANTIIATNGGAVTSAEAGYFHYTGSGAAGYNLAAVGNDVRLQQIISNAVINVSAPSTGAAPNTAAPAGGTGYSCSAVVWTPADNPFQGSTAYTATITLTANIGYTFGAGLTATINGQSATVSGNTGGTVTLSLTFPQTGADAVTGISVKTQPSVLTYNHGDVLDLSGLVVTLTYSAALPDDVPLAQFADFGITATPANGSILDISQNSTAVTVSCGNYSTNTNTLAVSNAPGAAITAPAMEAGKAHDSVTANAAFAEVNPGGQDIEYLLNTSASDYTAGNPSTWQPGLTFTGLSASTTYYVWARTAAKTGYDAGTPNVSAGITTLVTPTYGISLDISGTYTFTGAGYGYPVQTPLTVTVTNNGNQATGDLTVVLSGTSLSSFTISDDDVSGGIAVSGSETFNIAPNTGLTPGTYTATITVSGSGLTPQIFDMSFTVSKATQSLSINGLGGSYTYGDAAFDLSTAGGVGSGAVTYTSSDSTIASVSGNTVTILKAGTFTITAKKDEDANYAEASITSGMVTVSQATPNLSLIATGGADTTDPIILTATVSAVGTGAVPGGTVTFTESGGTLNETVTLNTAGVAEFTVNSPTGGSHTYTAAYSGQAGYYNENSDTETRIVGAADQAALSVIDVPTTITYGDGGFYLGYSGGNGLGAVTFSAPADNGVLTVTASGAALIVGAGTVTVTVTKAADNEYNQASATQNITVDPRNISNVSVDVTGSRIYTGSRLQPAFDVSDGTIAITTGDYTNDYGANVNAGPDAGSITLTGQGNYTGTKTVQFDIEPRPLTGAVITLSGNSFPHTGSDIEPGVISVVAGGVIVLATEYDVSYANNRNVGTAATVTVTAKATSTNFTGSVSTTFTITATGGNGGGYTPPTQTTTPEAKNDAGKTTDLPGGSTIDTPPGQDPIINDDGSLTLPGGGTITTPGNSDGKGGLTIVVPPGTVIDSDGRISFPQGSGGGRITDRYGNTFNVPEDAVIILDMDTPLGYFISIDNPFADVNQSDWFYDAVMFAYGHGLMVGTSANPMLFSPNATTTRGMIVTILYRMAGSPDVSGLVNPFSDVAAGKWYSGAVIWAAANGIVSGYGNGLFGAEDKITREQMAVMLANYIRYKGFELPVGQTTAFDDEASISAWALDAVKQIQAAGFVVGKPGGIYDPKGSATRAEIATIIARFIELLAVTQEKK